MEGTTKAYTFYHSKRYYRYFVPFLLFLTIIMSTKPAHGKLKLCHKNGRHKIGFITGYGFRNFDFGLDISLKGKWNQYDYTYKVVFLQLQYNYVLVALHKWELELAVQPQCNVTIFRYHNYPFQPNCTGYEAGFTGGLVVRRYISKYTSLYVYGASGPQYVPFVPKRQAPGLIFSDNVFVGGSVRVYKNAYLEVRTGFRHMSNADTKEPNPGINNMTFTGGILIKL